MSRKAAKNTAWKHFSKYIRLSQCLETTGSIEFGKCCDCGEVKPIFDLDAGHFVPGRGDSVLFVEDNVHIQCHTCNRHRVDRTSSRGGISPGYLLFMLNKYGEKKVTELTQLKYRTGKIPECELREIGKKYLAKVKELEKM